ncbi:MAG TPA: hypothetical protein VFI68_08035 [Anaerolineales bacterium]|nr:hypothetical protein [Anaerolineales bacterium]
MNSTYGLGTSASEIARFFGAELLVTGVAAWSAVAIYFFLALGFAWFQFMAPAK